MNHKLFHSTIVYFRPAAKPFAGHRKMTGGRRQGFRTPMLRGRKDLPKYTPLAEKKPACPRKSLSGVILSKKTV